MSVRYDKRWKLLIVIIMRKSDLRRQADIFTKRHDKAETRWGCCLVYSVWDS